MTCLSDLGLVLTDDREELAARLSPLLKEIHGLMSCDNELSKMVGYSVKERNENDKKRLAKLLDYKGPDDDTLAVLEKHRDQWLRDPYSFWIRPSPRVIESLNPEVYIVGCYLQTHRDDA
ncbi:hypothetical protein UCRPC4_g01159 [Phaeomoniella chlamydospora]|uniref:Uncharacterized protein n=1 Tax=Phaeomoniella chlamydospora TaxID=158046 RepID=A0A0G2GVH9_PHACM|nr:hypothetical protein UCRPC4_g01159 [Phaeomoniella chlamydospora]